ncbi:MAG: Na/Pi cotransporter family protein [Flavobacteriales bacterium]|nr:MAG: Na/Pi cotransporter family protein [Flavobacteriales bacterium]
MTISFGQIVQLLGSLAIFIFGLKLMSEGIQKAAGNKFRNVLNSMTAKPFYGLLTGILATVLIQSSSVTTVVVVGLANAGLLTLLQSIPVILGTNIGTTITAWLLTAIEFADFESSIVSYWIILIGLFMLLVRSSRWNNIGETIFGLGLLFLGINFMEMNAPDLQSNPQWLEFLRDNSYENTGLISQIQSILYFVGFGAALSVIVQSSSAAIAITLVLTSKGWIPLPLAIAMVLGENIGTTITAILAAFVGNTRAKRAALSHLLINVFGVVLAIIFFGALLNLTVSLTESISGKNPLEHSSKIPLALSIFHSSFNIINVAIMMFFVPSIAKLCTFIIRDRKDESNTDSNLELFNTKQAAAPIMALIRVRKEVHSMVKLNQRSFGYLPKILLEPDLNTSNDFLEKVQEMERTSDAMEVNILRYLSKVSENKLDSGLSEEVRMLMSTVNYLERCNDLILKSCYNLRNQKEQKAFFTPEQRNNLHDLMKLVGQIIDTLEEGCLIEKVDFRLIEDLENQINTKYRELRKDYLKKLENGKFSIQSGLFYMDILSEMERMADHVYSVAENLTQEDKV